MTKLTIGMATFEDFHGVWLTLQSLRLYHDCREVEVLIIDNHPSGEHGKEVKKLVKSWVERGANIGAIRYIEMDGQTGTTQPRNRIFAEASSPAVVCMDCHVMLPQGVVEKLIRFYDANPTTRDLFSGPMLYDGLTTHSTNFDPIWRDQMLGTWATHPSHPKPVGLWPWIEGDADRLAAIEEFEVPGQGLGLFTCRKEAWLGFNPNFRGFGGEEIYIHEKFRQAGAKAINLPWLYWLHRFPRPGGAKYRASVWDKVRNYVLGFNELGWSLEPIHTHFVGAGKLTQEEWDYLVADPVGRLTCLGSRDVTTPVPANILSLEELYLRTKGVVRDLDQHADTIRDYCSRVEKVTGFVKRAEWNVFAAAARPKSLIIYQTEVNDLVREVHAAVEQSYSRECRVAKSCRLDPYTCHEPNSDHSGVDSLKVTIAPTDLLILDTIAHGERLYQELKRHAPNVSSYIMFRGVKNFGSIAEGTKDQPGLLVGLRTFIKENPEWTVVHFNQNEYGFLVMSKLAKDKKKLPSGWRRLANFVSSMTAWAINLIQTGEGFVSKEVQEERLAHCTLCPAWNNGQCSACGCQLKAKVHLPTSFCPLGNWDPVQIEVAPDKKES